MVPLMWVVLLILIWPGFLMSTVASQPADWIFVEGVVRTLDPARPTAEALAVRGERIVFVGSASEVQALCGPDTRVVRLGGAALYPGFIDSHGHVAGLGKALRTVSLRGTKSVPEAVGRVRAAAAARPASGWLEGRGWDQNEWPQAAYPTWRDLEGASDVPVALRRVDGHALWVNRVALEAAGITAATPDPEGGKILRFADGSPTGVLIDNAEDLVVSRIPLPDEGELLARLRVAMQELAAAGLTGVMDAGVSAPTIAAYRRLAADGGLLVRVEVFLAPEDDLLAEWWGCGPEIGSYGGLFSVRGVKMFADGALGSRGAALLADYSDEPGNRGLLVTERERLRDVTRRSLAAGFDVGIHAIGDRANRIALDVFEEALSAGPRAGGRCRVEHAQVLAAEDLPRFARLRVIASMQPTHATSDMPWAERRLGPERIRGAYAWRSLRATGAELAFGSDFPVESHDPLLGVYAATTRMDRGGNPAGGWYADECLTMEEAVRAFTVGAAAAWGEEGQRGSLAGGKSADLVVLSQDLFTIAPREILRTDVLVTMVGGRVVFAREGWGGERP